MITLCQKWLEEISKRQKEPDYMQQVMHAGN